MKKVRYISILTVLLVCILSGCRSGRQAIVPSPEPQGDPLVLLKESYVDWTTVELPVRFELRSPKKFSISGTAKMNAGEAVLFSFRIFGMEVGNLWLTADSVQAILKPMGVYYKEDIASLTATTGISMTDIQNILMGHVFDVAQDKPFKVAFFAGFNDEGAARLDSAMVKPEGHKSVTINYGGPVVSPCGPFASSFGVETSVRNHNIDFSCRWDVERAKWNTGKALSAPRVPSDLRRLSSADLFTILKKL